MILRNPALLFLALAETLVWASSYYVFPALLLQWEAQQGWSRTDITGAITLAVFLSAFAAPLAGRLIDRGYGVLVMTLSTFLAGCCLFALSYVQTLVQFYAVWAVMGVLFAGSLYEPCFALVTRAKGAQARQSIILITLIAGFASTISFPAAHTLAELYGWRMAVQIFAAVVLVIVTPLMWLGARGYAKPSVEPTSRNEPIGNQESNVWRSSVFWLLAIGFASIAIVHGVALHHLLPILSEARIHPEVAVTAAAFIGPMQVGGRLVMMAFEKRVTNHVVIVSCFVTMILSVMLLMGVHLSPGFLVGFIILFAGGYGVVSIIRPLVTRELLGGNNFGAKSGAMALFFLSGSAIAPFLGSLVWQIGGYELVLSSLVVLGFAGLGVYFLANRYSVLSRS